MEDELNQALDQAERFALAKDYDRRKTCMLV
jgi:hypothetical protein